MHYTILSLNCHRISSGEFLGLRLSTLVHQGHHLLESNQSLVSQSPVKPCSNPNLESNPSCSSPSPVKSSSNPNPDSNPFRSSPKPVKPCSTPISDALSSEVSEVLVVSEVSEVSGLHLLFLPVPSYEQNSSKKTPALVPAPGRYPQSEPVL